MILLTIARVSYQPALEFAAGKRFCRIDQDSCLAGFSLIIAVCIRNDGYGKIAGLFRSPDNQMSAGEGIFVDFGNQPLYNDLFGRDHSACFQFDDLRTREEAFQLEIGSANHVCI